jgi:hypothetical protein
VAHVCNPRYSGGRDQEDLGSESAWANSSQDPILRKPSQKKGWWSGSRFRLSTNASTAKKRKRKKKESYYTI